jgi:hypothetical protein
MSREVMKNIITNTENTKEITSINKKGTEKKEYLCKLINADNLASEINRWSEDFRKKIKMDYENIFTENVEPCPNEFICPISKLIMYDPVTVVPSGNVYERDHIKKYVDNSKDSKDPLTRHNIKEGEIISNTNLKQKIEIFLKKNPSYRYSPFEVYMPTSYLEEAMKINDVNREKEIIKVITEFPLTCFVGTSFNGDNKFYQNNISIFNHMYKYLEVSLKNIKNEEGDLIDYTQKLFSDSIICEFIFGEYLKNSALLKYRIKMLNKDSSNNRFEIMETKNILNSLKGSLGSVLINSINVLNSCDFIEFLIKYLKIPLNVRNYRNENMFQIACRTNNLEIVRFLYEYEKNSEINCNIIKDTINGKKNINNDVDKIYNEFYSNDLSKNFLTPLHIAIIYNSNLVIEWMISKDEILNNFVNLVFPEDSCIKYINEMNSILLCVYSKNYDLFKQLMEAFYEDKNHAKFCIEKCDPLHWACLFSDEYIFRILCDIYLRKFGKQFLKERFLDFDNTYHKKHLIHNIIIDPIINEKHMNNEIQKNEISNINNIYNDEDDNLVNKVINNINYITIVNNINHDIDIINDDESNKLNQEKCLNYCNNYKINNDNHKIDTGFDNEKNNEKKIEKIKILLLYLVMCDYLGIKKKVIDLCDINGDTAIHYACLKSEYEIVKILKRHKINLFKKNFRKQTCIDKTKDDRIKDYLKSIFIENDIKLSIVENEFLFIKKKYEYLKRKRDGDPENFEDGAKYQKFKHSFLSDTISFVEN